MKKVALVILSGIISSTLVFGQNSYSSWGLFKYSAPGLDQSGLLSTRHSKDIKSSSWSVGCETLDRDYADFSACKNHVGELGVKHVRLQSGWAKLCGGYSKQVQRCGKEVGSVE